MLCILSGPDDFSVARSLDEIKKSLDDSTTLTINTTNLDGKEVTPDNLKNICQSVPFLGGKRLVIINGLLERFEAKEKSSRKKNTHSDNHKDEPKLFGDYLTNLPDSTAVVLIDGEIKGTNPLLRELSGKANVKSFPLLKDAQLRQWVHKRVTEVSGSISTQAEGLLIQLVGSNLWIMSNEIDKLVTFASGRRIEEADVRKLVVYVQQANAIFAMIDDLIEFKVNAAEQRLERLLQEGAVPAYILFMITRQVRLIVRTKELQEQGKPDRDIQNKLGLTHEFVLRKTLDQAAKYSLPRLRDFYHRLLETDIAIKTGRYDGELALNILVAELSRQKVA